MEDEMSNSIKFGSMEFSRRSLLRGVAAAGSATALAVSVEAAMAKTAQSAVAYQTSPNGDRSCAICTNFQPPSDCKLVEGPISPGGWCKLWAKKPSPGSEK
jgi:hypothetical protein